MKKIFNYWENRDKYLIYKTKDETLSFAKYMHRNGYKYENNDDYLEYYIEDWNEALKLKEPILIHDLRDRDLVDYSFLTDECDIIYASDFIFGEEKSCKFMKKRGSVSNG